MVDVNDTVIVTDQNFDLWEDKIGFPFTLTYTFLDTLPGYIGFSLLFNGLEIDSIDGHPAFDKNTFQSLVAIQKNAVNSLLETESAQGFRASFTDVLKDVVFSNMPQTGNGTLGTGDIVIGLASKLPGAPATLRAGNFSEVDVSDGSFITDKSAIFIDANNASLNDPTNYGEGGIGKYILLHEIGHSLGLRDYSVESASLPFNNMKYSVMSYAEYVGYVPTNLMLLDIAALQDRYGRNYETRNLDTVYSKDNVLFDERNPNGAVLYSIWDGGGEDTIDASGFTDHVQIDLRQGHFSSIGKYIGSGPVFFDNSVQSETNQFDPTTGLLIPDNPDHGNISIAFHAVIENAIGTDDVLGDILIGNAWGNRLEGRGGDDWLYGDGFVYDGDSGFMGVDPNDPRDPNRNVPQSDDDILIGGAGNDRLFGGSGNDTLDGGAGNDTLMGGTGNDIFIVSAGTDEIDGQGGDDTLDFSAYSAGVTVSIFGNYSVQPGISGQYTDIDHIILGSGNDLADLRSGQSIDAPCVFIEAGDGIDTVKSSFVAYLTADGILLTDQNQIITGVENFVGKMLVSDLASGAGFGYGYTNTTLDASLIDHAINVDLYTRTLVDGGRSYTIGNLYAGTDFGDTIVGGGEILLGAGNDTVSSRTGGNFDLRRGGDDTIYLETSGTPNSSFITYATGHDTIHMNKDTRVFINLASNIQGPDVTITETNVQTLSVSQGVTRLSFDLHIDIANGGSLALLNAHKILFNGNIVSNDVNDIYLANGSRYNSFTSNYALVGPGTFNFSTPLPTSGNDVLTTQGLLTTSINGGFGDDIMSGTNNADTLMGDWGDDTLSGGGGDDILSGGFGNDSMYGGAGSDSMYGAYGNDVMYGGDGDDFINGEYDDDTLYGEDGNDIINGGMGNDTYIGGAGDDVLADEGGDDTFIFNPGDGNDTIIDQGGSLDTLHIGGNINLAALTFTQVGSDLVIHIASGVTIKDQFSGDPSKVVEWVSFDDGTIVQLPNPFMQTNQPPIAVGDIFSLDEDTLFFGNVTVNDTDPDHDVLSVVSGTFTTVAGGTVVIQANGDFTYHPLPNFNGADSFDYTLADPDGASDTATVSLTVNPVNDAPDAKDDLFNGAFGQKITGNLLINNGNGVDFDIDGDSLIVEAQKFTTTNGGHVSVNTDGSFTYMPAFYFFGTDSFSYAIFDGHGGTDTATVSLNISAPQGAVFGTNGRDVITGGRADNVIFGLDGNDILNGNGGKDTLVGGTGNDTLHGGNGNDVLYGGRGADTLFGGNGKDKFIIDSTDAVDTIGDFKRGDDAINISALLEQFDPLTDAIRDFVRLTEQNGQTTIAIDQDGGRNSFAAAVIVQGNLANSTLADLISSGALLIS